MIALATKRPRNTHRVLRADAEKPRRQIRSHAGVEIPLAKARGIPKLPQAYIGTGARKTPGSESSLPGVCINKAGERDERANQKRLPIVCQFVGYGTWC